MKKPMQPGDVVKTVFDETDPEYLLASEHLYSDAARMKQFFGLNDGSRLVVWHNGEAIFPDMNLVDYAHRFEELFGGLKIAANVSLDPALAELTGFTEADLREMLEYYRENEFDFDVESVLRQMADWYDHYVFARGMKSDGTPVKSVASPILVLAYMLYFVRNHAVPDDLVDKNLRTDYAKIRHVITESRKLNGNYHRLEDIIVFHGGRVVCCEEV